METWWRSRALPGVLLLLSASCGQDSPATRSISADSAAVESVGSPAPAGVTEQTSNLDQEWARVTERILELGEIQGATELLFSRIRAVRLLPDGGVLVADGSSQELRVFGRQGALEARFGGNGSGPGEFLYLASALVLGRDSIAAYDSRSHRLSLFNRSGTLLFDRRLPGSGGLADELVGRLGAGVYLLARRVMPNDGPEGVQRGLVHYVRIDLNRERADTLATVQGNEIEFVRNEAGNWVTYEIPFARTALSAAGSGDSWVEGATDRWEVRRRDFDGRLEHVVTLPEAESPLTAEDIAMMELATMDRLEPTATQAESIRRRFREVPAPELKPAFSNLIVDDADRLWLGSWYSPFTGPGSEPRQWRVFDGNGSYLGSVALPSAFDAHDVRGENVAGVEVDDLGVERVVVLRFSR